MNAQTRSIIFLILIFGLGTCSFGYIFFQTKERNQHLQGERFKMQAEHYIYAIDQRYLRNQLILEACQGLIQSSDYVSKDEWDRFCSALPLAQNFPAIHWVALARSFETLEMRQSFLENVTDAETPDFHIWPQTEDPHVAPIIYIYPNQYKDLLGYNLLEKPEILQKAKGIKSGEFFSSKAVSLKHYDTSNSHILLICPIFNKKENGETLFGYSAALIDFFTIVNQLADDLKLQDINIQVYQGKEIDPTALSFQKISVLDPKPAFHYSQSLAIGDLTWTFYLSSTPTAHQTAASGLAYLTFFLLVLANIGLSIALYRLIRTRMQTNSLSTNPIFNSMKECILMTDLNGKILFFNQVGEDLFDSAKTFDELVDPKDIEIRAKLFAKEGLPSFHLFMALSEEKFAGGVEWSFKKKDQSFVTVTLRVIQIKDANAKVLGYLGIGKIL